MENGKIKITMNSSFGSPVAKIIEPLNKEITSYIENNKNFSWLTYDNKDFLIESQNAEEIENIINHFNKLGIEVVKEIQKIGTIKINVHPTYHYSTAIVTDGFSRELGEYVRNNDWLMWERNRQICIQREDGTELQTFIDYVEDLGFEVFTRDTREDEWTPHRLEANPNDRRGNSDAETRTPEKTSEYIRSHRICEESKIRAVQVEKKILDCEN